MAKKAAKKKRTRKTSRSGGKQSPVKKAKGQNPPAKADKLPQLAKDINSLQKKMMLGIKRTVESAVEIGEKLIEAKAQKPHGGWTKWLTKNCDLAVRTAQKYMQLAKHGKSVGTTVLTIEGALDGVIRHTEKAASLKALANPGDSDDDSGDLEEPLVTRFRSFKSAVGRAIETARANLFIRNNEEELGKLDPDEINQVIQLAQEVIEALQRLKGGRVIEGTAVTHGINERGEATVTPTGG